MNVIHISMLNHKSRNSRVILVYEQLFPIITDKGPARFGQLYMFLSYELKYTRILLAVIPRLCFNGLDHYCWSDYEENPVGFEKISK